MTKLQSMWATRYKMLMRPRPEARVLNPPAIVNNLLNSLIVVVLVAQ